MLTMMIVMDCLHFANYFVPLIYNGELSQSALKGRHQLIAFAKSMAGHFFVVLSFFSPLSFCGSTKDWIRFNNSDTFLSKQTGRCQWRGLTESCHTVLETDGSAGVLEEVTEFLLRLVRAVNHRRNLFRLPTGSPAPHF